MFITIFSEPAIIIITLCFLFCLLKVLASYLKVEKELRSVCNFLHNLNKKEMSYRFGELDEYMSSNSYTNTIWEDFKKALIFPEKFYTIAQNEDSGKFSSEIYLTLDSSYFFNEDSLVYSKINYRFIQTMPTLLTGLGPFFTFLKMAMAFAKVDFTESNVSVSINNLVSDIQIAALCSVFAVGYSLLFIFLEKTLYNAKCKKYYLLIQKEFIRLFDVCTSEQFLLDLVKETRVQNLNNEKILSSLPENFAKTITKSMGDLAVPYLENILYSLNKLNTNFSKNNGSDDIVDKLF